MTTENNLAVIRRGFEEIWNRGNLAVADEPIAIDVVVHSPGEPEPLHGLEDFKRFNDKLRTGFPDLRVTIDDIFGLGDKVTVRFTARGTHLGQYRGLPPTGVRMTVTEICIYRLANGKVQELWQELNALGVMQQLGVVPPEGAGPLGLLSWVLRTIARFALLDIRARSGRRKGPLKWPGIGQLPRPPSRADVGRGISAAHRFTELAAVGRRRERSGSPRRGRLPPAPVARC